MVSAGREGSRRRRLSHSALVYGLHGIILERGRRRHKDARDASASGFRHQSREEASDQWVSRWRMNSSTLSHSQHVRKCIRASPRH